MREHKFTWLELNERHRFHVCATSRNADFAGFFLSLKKRLVIVSAFSLSPTTCFRLLRNIRTKNPFVLGAPVRCASLKPNKAKIFFPKRHEAYLEKPECVRRACPRLPRTSKSNSNPLVGKAITLFPKGLLFQYLLFSTRCFLTPKANKILVLLCRKRFQVERRRQQ